MKNNEKYLIVLGAGPQQKPVYERAKALGIKTLAMDYNPNAISLQLASDYIIAQIKDSDECIDVLKKSNLNYAGVMAHGVEIAPVVSAIAKEFDLTAVSEKVAHRTTNKCARFKRLDRKKIPIPKYEILEQKRNPTIPIPFVVKPSDSSGSRGVRLVKSLHEFDSAYKEALSFSSDGRVVIDEYLIGDEISIEGFVLDGHVFVNMITDRNFLRVDSTYPYFVEDGSSSPSKFSTDTINKIKEVFSKAVVALGIKNGPSKGDLIVTNEGVYVLEITSRLSPASCIFTSFCLGVDNLTETIKWAVGIKVDKENLIPSRNRGMAHRYFSHKPGIVNSIKGFTNLYNKPGVIDVVVINPFSIGDRLEPASYLNRLFYIVACADTREEAISYAQKALSDVKIEVD